MIIKIKIIISFIKLLFFHITFEITIIYYR